MKTKNQTQILINHIDKIYIKNDFFISPNFVTLCSLQLKEIVGKKIKKGESCFT